MANILALSHETIIAIRTYETADHELVKTYDISVKRNIRVKLFHTMHMEVIGQSSCIRENVTTFKTIAWYVFSMAQAGYYSLCFTALFPNENIPNLINRD